MYLVGRDKVVLMAAAVLLFAMGVGASTQWHMYADFPVHLRTRSTATEHNRPSRGDERRRVPLFSCRDACMPQLYLPLLGC